jgi:hypothetical protein
MRKLVAGVFVIALGLSFAPTSFAEDPPGGVGSVDGGATDPAQGGSGAAPRDNIVPASLSMRLYRFGLSTSPTCSPLQIFEVEKPALVDFTTNPDLGAFHVEPGSYECVALEIDGVVKGTPFADNGKCVKGQEATVDICTEFARLAAANPTPQPGSFDGFQPFGGGGPSLTCPGGDRFVVYLTTQITERGKGNAGRPPLDANDKLHGYPLGGALKVTDHTTGTLIVTSTAEAQSDSCIVGAPTFAFTTN